MVALPESVGIKRSVSSITIETCPPPNRVARPGRALLPSPPGRPLLAGAIRNWPVSVTQSAPPL